MKKLITTILLGTLATLSQAAADNRPELRILNPSPLSGLVKDTGTQQAQAIEKGLAYLSTNSKYKVSYKAVDDKYDPVVALKVIPESVESFNPHAVVGLFGTPNVQKLVETGFFEKYKIPMIGSRSGATTGVFNPYTHHLRASFADEIQTYIKLAAVHGSKKIGILYTANSFGAEGLNAIKEYTKAHHEPNDPVLVAAESHPKDTTQVKAAVEKLMAQKLDVIVLMTTTAPAREAIKEIRAATTNKKTSIKILAISSIDPDGLQLEKLAINDGKFWVAFSSVVPNYAEEFQTQTSILTEYSSFIKATGLSRSTTTLEGFIIAKTTMAAAEKVEAPMTREKLQAELTHLRVRLSPIHSLHLDQIRASSRVFFDYYDYKSSTNKLTPL